MILFNCQECGRKFQVKDEFAGRSTKCPGCQQPLVVPDAARTEAYVPKDRIDGAPSSLDQTGTDAGVSLPGPSRPDQKSIPAIIADRDKSAGRYVLQGEIARGGMGAVVRGIDCDLRREVAIKFMLNDKDGRQKTRFVEEAQITGQLEHPNIVPIHELGVDAQKRLFFTMKMVKGRSLAQILDELAKNPAAASEWSLGRLLNIVVNICHALGYAHSRNVIHRDLKPANIMVGDFGEVYVMDWGLAKVLGSEVPSRKTSPDAIAARPLPPHATGGSVSTSRETEGDLTQAGSILGTPAYMPPEQAHGKIDAIDQRSDIYSLGAILYAVLTLLPPVEKGGNQMAVLMRVGEGDIKKPEVRTPQRYIPAEVSAIAMKALAKDPADRYQTVEALRKDVELFLEGRSVSAKQDSFREMAWKLVKRNKGASITAAAALLVLAAIAGVFFKLNYDARILAEDERNNAQVERNKAKEAYQAYLDQVKGSVPLLLRSAKTALGERQYDDALAQASIAAKSAPDNAEARLLTGELLITRLRFAEAAAELKEYRKLKGGDAGVQKLAELCGKAEPKDVDSLMAIAEAFTQRGEHALADGVLSGEGKDALEARKNILEAKQRIQEARQRVLEIYRKRIEAAWPGQGNKLTMSKEGQYSLRHLVKVTDLTPLRGMQLTTLDLQQNDQLRDLEPLKGMPLTSLNLHLCKEVQNLEPLRGMPLTWLVLNITQVRDLKPLKGMPLTWLDFSLTQVQNLEPLKGMPLTHLYIQGTQVRDLEPLKGMPLTSLRLDLTQIRDLEPLKGMPLTSLSLSSTQVRDLGLLKGMPLTSLNLSGTQVRDLGLLRGMPLTFLGIADCKQVQNLELLKGMPLKGLHIGGSGVTDLTPLQGMELEDIRLAPKNISPDYSSAYLRSAQEGRRFLDQSEE